MTLTSTNIQARPAARDNAVLRTIRAYVAGWVASRRTVQELSSLRARDLTDLGISAYDIPRIAREARNIAAAKVLAA